MPAGAGTQDSRSRFKGLFAIAILWRKKSNFIFKPKNKQQLGYEGEKIQKKKKKKKKTHGIFVFCFVLFFFFQNFPENCVFFHRNNILQRFIKGFFLVFKTQLLKSLFLSKYKAFKRLTKQREYNSTSRVLKIK